MKQLFKLLVLLWSIIFLNSCTKCEDYTAAECDLEETSFTFVEKMPAYLGRNEAIDSFIKANLIYPESAKQNKTEGMVAVQFIVDKNGYVSCPKIKKSLSNDCDTEALRIIHIFPRWEPGVHNNKPVNITFRLLIEFKM